MTENPDLKTALDLLSRADLPNVDDSRLRNKLLIKYKIERPPKRGAFVPRKK